MELTKQNAKTNIIIIDKRILNLIRMQKNIEEQINKLNEVKELLYEYVETGNEEIKNQIQLMEKENK